MKKVIVFAALAAGMIATPALAQSRYYAPSYRAAMAARMPVSATLPGAIDNRIAVYDYSGRYLGQDPDPNVRLMLRRDDNWDF